MNLDIEREAFYYLLHREACSRAQSDGRMQRFFASKKGVPEFEIGKYLNLFQEYEVEPEASLPSILKTLYEMGWNETDHNLASKEILDRHGYTSPRVTVPSDVAMFIVCFGCDRKVYTLQEETYTDYLDDDSENHYCHDCVPQHVYDAAVERAERKGYLRRPPLKAFS